MSAFLVKIDELNAWAENAQVSEAGIKNASTVLDSIVENIHLSGSMPEIRDAIIACREELKCEVKALHVLSEQLRAIKTLYVSNESDLVVGITGSGEAARKNDNQVSGDEKVFDLDKWLSEQTGISEDTIEIVKFILGFIPVINCVTDIYQLIDDVTSALGDDGKITGGEWFALATDVVFLGLDIVAAGEIVKAVKTAKVATTEAKAAEKVAEQAAKRAEKRAAKSGGSVATTTAAQKATKAARNATRKASQAENAKMLAKDATKDVVVKTANGVVDNVVDEYMPTAQNAGMPNAVKRESRDNLILSY